MDFHALDRRIEEMRDQYLTDLANWIAIPSVSAPAEGENAPFGRGVRKMLDQAMADARRYGFETRDFDGYCADITMGKGEKTMGILAHLDVVPAGDGWLTPPFSLAVFENLVHGRGVMDDKGPALAALYAMRAVRDAGFSFKHKVRLILGCDEETGMTDMEHYKSKADLPHYGFSPDAEFPVINIEKGGLNALLSAYLPDDPAKNYPVYSIWAGERPNVVPGVARAVVGVCEGAKDALFSALELFSKEDARFIVRVESIEDGRATIVSEGKSAHASTPDLGVNAAVILLKALCRIKAGGENLQRAILTLAEKIDLEGDGRALGIAMADEESGALSCNLGILRFDGKFLCAQLDIRYPLCAQEAALVGNIALSVSDGKLAVTKISAHAPHHVPADSEVVQKLIQSYTDVTGLPGYAFAIGGGTYSRCMPNTVAFGPCFPGDIDPCHMPNEWIDLNKMFTSIKIMAHAIANLACEAK